jgi:hypothetical protein
VHVSCPKQGARFPDACLPSSILLLYMLHRTRLSRKIYLRLLVVDTLLANGVTYPSMLKELADSDPSIDQRRYWPRVWNIARPSLAGFPSSINTAFPFCSHFFLLSWFPTFPLAPVPLARPETCTTPLPPLEVPRTLPWPVGLRRSQLVSTTLTDPLRWLW